MREEIISPKLFNNKSDFTNKSALYHYYPGYSEGFVRQMIERYCKNKQASLVLDPWNGSGTTTLVSSVLGYNSIGFDINPVMVVVAKAKLHTPSLKEVEYFLHLVRAKSKKGQQNDVEQDPLSDWFDKKSIQVIRNIEQITLNYCEQTANSENDLMRFSNKTCFYYTVMFNVLRRLTVKFSSSNPTWIKHAREKSELLTCTQTEITALLENYFKNIFHVSNIVFDLDYQLGEIKLGNSENLPLENNSVSIIISSPPYCTRIDYAIYTRVEFAYLGYNKYALKYLRHQMIGTPTIISKINAQTELVEYCKDLLCNIKEHYSKASESYYYKTYNQYFTSLTKSICEFNRVIVPNGTIAIVVQDSWFKDIYIDLQRILTEIFYSYGIDLIEKHEFSVSNNMGYLNNCSKKYRNKADAKESVLVFKKRG